MAIIALVAVAIALRAGNRPQVSGLRSRAEALPSIVEANRSPPPAAAVVDRAPGGGTCGERCAHPATALGPQMRSATDLRVFAEHARQHPEAGGVSYAIFSTMLCRGQRAALADAKIPPGASLRYVAPEDPRRYAEREALFERAVLACASYDDGELAAESRKQLFGEAAAREDRWRTLSGETAVAVRDGSADERRKTLQAVLDTGDPLLLSFTLERLLREKSGDALYQLAGSGVDALQADAFRAAVRALPCRLGLVCDERAPEVLESCLQPDTCATDLVDLLRARLDGPKARADFDATLAQLERAAAGRNAAGFIR